MRGHIRTEAVWQNGVWHTNLIVHYVYDGNVVLQERHYHPNISSTRLQKTVTYTRGSDLSGSLQGAGGIGGLLARSQWQAWGTDLSTALYHSDGNGNVTLLLGTNQQILARYLYEPFGNLITSSGPLAEENLYRFSSKEAHTQSGLVYYLYRFYDPNLQKWVNRDPIEEDGGINLYAFVGNSPTGNVDSYGEEGVPIIGTLWQSFKAARCRRKLNKWYEDCVKDIPPCTRGVGEGSKGPCPFDAPGQDPGNHWFICNPTRQEKIADCAAKAQDVFNKCMGIKTLPGATRL